MTAQQWEFHLLSNAVLGFLLAIPNNSRDNGGSPMTYLTEVIKR